MTAVNRTHRHLPKGHVCRVELVNGAAAGVSVDSSPRCGVVFPLVPCSVASPPEGRSRRDAEVLVAQGVGGVGAEPRNTRPATTPSICGATTMAAASEVCFVVISQDTPLETVLEIHLFLRTLSWCKVSLQFLDGNDGADCVKSSKFIGILTRVEPAARGGGAVRL